MLKFRLPSCAAMALALLTAANAMAQPSAATVSKDFAQASVGSDQYEIHAARVVITETKNADIRAFAEQMIQDHTRLSEATKQAASQAGVAPPPDAMSGDQAKLLGALQSLTGQPLDKAYAHQQVLAHESALVVESRYAQAGSSPPLKAAAQTAVPLIQHHLEMARSLDR